MVRRAILGISLTVLVAALGSTGLLSMASLVPLPRDGLTTVRHPAAAAAPAESPDPLPVLIETPEPEPGLDESPVLEPIPAGIGGSTRDVRWDIAVHTRDGGRIGIVLAAVVNVRAAPSLDAPIVDTVYGRHPVTVYDDVVGDPVDGNPVWHRIGADRYVSATMVEPFVPPAPGQTFAGRWLDVNLSTFYAVAYQGSTPVYAAIITAGRDGKTPTGVFEVLLRVRDETMDAATLGIPEDDPRYYHLENVQYTQYFKDGGYALHENYWTPPDAFGGFGSNGCIGLLEADAAFLWDFLDFGSPISIHF